MASVEFSTKEHKFGVRYDIGNNKEYRFTNKFEFDYVYEFLTRIHHPGVWHSSPRARRRSVS